MAKILIVDDEPRIRELIREHLQYSGYICEEAADGTAALTQLSGGAFDLVILDLMMPFMDGMTCLREMRARHINTPVIILTARGEEYDKLAGLESGADDYVVKPFSPRELVARVKAVLNRTMPKPAAASDTMTFGELTIDTASHTVRVSGEDAFALFVQKSSISLRIIALILRWSKNDSNKAIAGMMIATALLSTIIDDLILVLMMLPFAYKILDENHTPWGSKSNLAKALILGIAFASYIGGWITPVGSVVNIFAMQFAEQATGVTVTFANWMVLGFIMCIVTLPLAYLGIIKIFKPEPITDEALQRIESEYKALPSLTKDEIWGSLVILGALILWILSSWFPQFDLVVVGLVAFGLMFLPPFKCINFREYAKESAWEVVMLNWGVGCFVAGITATGAMAWLVNSIFGSMSAIPLVVILLPIVLQQF